MNFFALAYERCTAAGRCAIRNPTCEAVIVTHLTPGFLHLCVGTARGGEKVCCRLQAPSLILADSADQPITTKPIVALISIDSPRGT